MCEEACHAKWRSMSPSATPATQTAAAPARPKHHQSQPSAVSTTPAMSPRATPATQSEGRCRQVPRLPHKLKVDVTNLPRVTKRHACHANSRGARQTQVRHQSRKCHTCKCHRSACGRGSWEVLVSTSVRSTAAAAAAGPFMTLFGVLA